MDYSQSITVLLMVKFSLVNLFSISSIATTFYIYIFIRQNNNFHDQLNSVNFFISTNLAQNFFSNKFISFLLFLAIFFIIVYLENLLRKKVKIINRIVFLYGFIVITTLNVYLSNNFINNSSLKEHNYLSLALTTSSILGNLLLYSFLFLGNHLNMFFLAEDNFKSILFLMNFFISISFASSIIYPKLLVFFTIIIFAYCIYPYVLTKGGNSPKFSEISKSKIIYFIAKNIAKLMLKIYNRLTYLGAENCPSIGPLIIVANHSSALDGFFIGCCLHRQINTMVKQESFENPFMSWFLRKVYSFPVDRFKPDPSAYKTSIKILSNGEILALFPEGTRNPLGKIKPFKPGAIRLATKLKIPILPAFIDGNHLINPPKTFIPRPHKLTVQFGSLIDVSKLMQEGKSEDEISQIVYNEVVKLGTTLRKEDVRDLS